MRTYISEFKRTLSILKSYLKVISLLNSHSVLTEIKVKRNCLNILAKKKSSSRK